MSEADAAFDRLIASLQAQGFTEKAKPDLLAAFKKDMRAAFQEVADDNGVKVENIVAELIVGIFCAWRFGHHARRGNVTKTIWWGVTVLNTGQSYRARQLRTQLKKKD